MWSHTYMFIHAGYTYIYACFKGAGKVELSFQSVTIDHKYCGSIVRLSCEKCKSAVMQPCVYLCHICIIKFLPLVEKIALTNLNVPASNASSRGRRSSLFPVFSNALMSFSCKISHRKV